MSRLRDALGDWLDRDMIAVGYKIDGQRWKWAVPKTPWWLRIGYSLRRLWRQL